MAKTKYITKDDLSSSLEGVKKEIKTAILESEEKVLGELQDIREEFATHQYSHRRINEEIEELQKAVL